jgi:hypothetical protein
MLASELYQCLNFHAETVDVLDVGVWYLPLTFKKETQPALHKQSVRTAL